MANNGSPGGIVPDVLNNVSSVLSTMVSGLYHVTTTAAYTTLGIYIFIRAIRAIRAIRVISIYIYL